MATDFPKASEHLSPNQLTYLMSPFVLELPKEVFKQAQTAIKVIYKISREYPERNKVLREQLEKFCPKQNKNSSVLMAYDFHLAQNDLRLIEINTNGAGFILADLSQRAHNLGSSLPCLQLSFSEEMKAINAKSVSIIDRNPKEQKMYAEFLMYQRWFQSWGIDSTINDFRDLQWDGNQLLFESCPVNFIYNRYCDFFLGEELSTDLSLAYKSGNVIFSPQPREYLLLSDKQRLMDWGGFQSQLKGDEKKILQRVLIHSREAHSFESPEELWSLRKKLFFKPKNSYGSRSTYQGKSISKKNFERVVRENFIVQEFIPPAQVRFNGGDPWKYDLRFYTFKDQIQLSIARIYRGQLTNFKEFHGGFTTVQFT